MTSNNHHADGELLLMSGFKKQMLYISLISLAVVVYTFAEISFSNKYSHFSSVTPAQRGIKPNEDNANFLESLGDKYKLPTSETNLDRPKDGAMNDKSRLGIPTTNRKKPKHRHSRVVCVGSKECRALNNDLNHTHLLPSWDAQGPVISSRTRVSTSSSDVRDKDGVCGGVPRAKSKMT
mmetsp:Transcript_32386/g.55249  ORF Transcript_32386/g.55249 Transcript_32386/m.55249 type:complete len:179 (+) Transcript_32386:106-642(+)